MLTNLPIIGSDHAFAQSGSLFQSDYIWCVKIWSKMAIKQRIFLLVKDVWSLVVQGSHAYQLTSKIQMLKSS